MAKGWVSKWGPRGKGHRPSHIPAIEIIPTSIDNKPWKLPPSKSHIIRKILLCALSKGKHTLLGFDELGEDAESMQRCLTQLGVQFETVENGIEITGVGIEGFHRSPSVLHAGNSGTALRLLIGLTSRLDFISMIDGDASLRNRNHTTLLSALSPMGVKLSYGIEQERLPILIHGPWIGSELSVDVSHSSQPYSSILLSTCGIETPSTIKTVGDAVSRRHSALTIELMRASGASLEVTPGVTTLQPWTSNPPEIWDVPPDASMMAFPVLACLLNNQSIQIENPVESMHSLGHEVLLDHINSFGVKESDGTLSLGGDVTEVDIDLRDANDLLPPMAAILALSGGGRLRGAAHAKHKESNRIDCTAHLLKCFGLTCKIEEDGLSIEGGQQITKPEQFVETFGDHRIQMTAVLLATQTGGTIEGPRLHRIADPAFLTRLSTVPTEVLVKGIQRES
jgi:3-phosphoshikimate 1-carboxyvinyltransferase